MSASKRLGRMRARPPENASVGVLIVAVHHVMSKSLIPPTPRSGKLPATPRTAPLVGVGVGVGVDSPPPPSGVGVAVPTTWATTVFVWAAAVWVSGLGV